MTSTVPRIRIAVFSFSFVFSFNYVKHKNNELHHSRCVAIQLRECYRFFFFHPVVAGRIRVSSSIIIIRLKIRLRRSRRVFRIVRGPKEKCFMVHPLLWKAIRSSVLFSFFFGRNKWTFSHTIEDWIARVSHAPPTKLDPKTSQRNRIPKRKQKKKQKIKNIYPKWQSPEMKDDNEMARSLCPSHNQITVHT